MKKIPYLFINFLNNKKWNKIHPEHLNLILRGYLKYKDGNSFKFNFRSI